MAFPLLRVPPLPLDEIVKGLDPLSMLHLGLMAPRLRRLWITKKITVSLKVNAKKETYIDIMIERFKINVKMLIYYYEEETYKEYRLDKAIRGGKFNLMATRLLSKKGDEFRKIIDMIANIFSISSTSLTISNDTVDNSFGFFDAIRNKSAVIPELSWSTDSHLDTERMVEILKEAPRIKKLSVNFASGVVRISGKDLYGLVDAEDVSIEKLDLKGEDIKEFLNYWQENNGRLKIIRISTLDIIKADEVLDGDGSNREIRLPDGTVLAVGFYNYSIWIEKRVFYDA